MWGYAVLSRILAIWNSTTVSKKCKWFYAAFFGEQGLRPWGVHSQKWIFWIKRELNFFKGIILKNRYLNLVIF